MNAETHLSKFSIVWCVLLHVKHYKLMASSVIGKVAGKKDAEHARLVVPKSPAKTKDELAYEEYKRQLELAIENH